MSGEGVIVRFIGLGGKGMVVLVCPGAGFEAGCCEGFDVAVVAGLS